MIKFTPIAASVALTLGLTACGTDNDGNVYVPPAQTFNSEKTAQFNVEVTGKAVKGAMKNAVVSVSTMNASGEMVPVAFRLEASEEADTFTGQGTSQEAADAAAAAKVIEENPDTVITNESGRYSIFLENDFSGPVYITVKTSTEDDDSYLRCDAYLGCGSYETAPEQEEGVNDGDTAIEFGEWYKTDLELSVVKFIPAIEAETAGASGALGDANVDRSFKANATFLTSIVAQLLIESGEDVDASDIADASLKTIIQLMGPETALLIPELLADVSNGGAIDLSDVDGEEKFTDGILALTQVASSLQGLPSIGESLSTLKKAIKAGKFVGSDDNDITALAVALQQAVTNTVNIFLAVATGDEAQIQAALVAAFNVNNPNASEAERTAFAQQANGIAVKAKAAKDKAVKNGAASDEELAKSAEKAKEVLAVIGCADNCAIGDEFYAQLALSVIASIDTSETELADIQASVTDVNTDLAAAQSLGGDTVTDAQSAIAFASAVALLSEKAELAELDKKSNAVYVKSQSLVAAGKLLVANNSSYQQILDSANNLLSEATSEVEKVAKFDLDLATLETEAQAVIEEYEVAVAVAAEVAQVSADLANQAKTVATTAEAESTSALADAQNAPLDNADNAADALELANEAVTAASQFSASVDELQLAIAQAKDTAEDYLDVSVSDEDKDKAQQLVDDAKSMAEDALEQAELASEQLAAAFDLQSDAELAIAKFTALVSVKETSDSLSKMTVLTSTGGDAVVEASDVLVDVINELAEMGSSGNGVSTRQPDWIYLYSLDDLTLTLENSSTGEMISAAGSYQDDKLVVAWGGMLAGEDATVKVVTADSQANALKDCVDFVAGDIDETSIDSCLVVTFDSTVDAENVDDAEILNTKSWNHVEIVDGDSGFTGMLNVIADEVNETDSVTLDGMSGDLEFKVMGMVDSSGEQDQSELEVMVKGDAAMGYTLSLMGTESDGYTGDVKAMYNGDMMSFGTATKVTNGVSITYIDGVSIDYTDVDLIDSTK